MRETAVSPSSKFSLVELNKYILGASARALTRAKKPMTEDINTERGSTLPLGCDEVFGWKVHCIGYLLSEIWDVLVHARLPSKEWCKSHIILK